MRICFCTFGQLLALFFLFPILHLPAFECHLKQLRQSETNRIITSIEYVKSNNRLKRVLLFFAWSTISDKKKMEASNEECKRSNNNVFTRFTNLQKKQGLPSNLITLNQNKGKT